MPPGLRTSLALLRMELGLMGDVNVEAGENVGISSASSMSKDLFKAVEKQTHTCTNQLLQWFF